MKIKKNILTSLAISYSFTYKKVNKKGENKYNNYTTVYK